MCASLPPETAHTLGVWSAELGIIPVEAHEDDPKLTTRVWGLEFSNPIGIAAGFDKDARAMDGLTAMGFGFVEVGTITPLPQPGNPSPRVFRLETDRAVINRYGFNSEGLQAAAERLAHFQTRRDILRIDVLQAPPPPPSSSLFWKAAVDGRVARAVVGVNVGRNKTGTEDDYPLGVRTVLPFADYIVLNISSPNTPGLRSLQGKEQLLRLLQSALQARDQRAEELGISPPPPLLVKVAPDLTQQDVDDIAEVVLQTSVDGVIVANTTVERPAYLHGANRTEGGGLSGRPLKDRALQVLRLFYARLGGRVPLVGVGGIETGEDAYQRLRAGASLVQLYTAMVFEGPTLPQVIKRELLELMQRDGIDAIDHLVGLDARGDERAN